MARPQRTVFQTIPPVNNTTEYKGCLIEVLEQPVGFYVAFVTIDGTRRRARNMEHAKQLIDAVVGNFKELELRSGGWVKNPPKDCHHTRIDREGLWVECVMCVFFCMNTSCPAYILIMGNKRKPKEIEIREVNVPLVEPVTPVDAPRINRRQRS